MNKEWINTCMALIIERRNQRLEHFQKAVVIVR